MQQQQTINNSQLIYDAGSYVAHVCVVSGGQW